MLDLRWIKILANHQALPMSALGQMRWREPQAELADLRQIKAFPSECP